MDKDKEEESLTGGNKEDEVSRAKKSWSPLQPEVVILEKEKRLQRGCAQVLLKAGFQQDEKWGFRKREGTVLAGDTQTHSQGL